MEAQAVIVHRHTIGSTEPGVGPSQCSPEPPTPTSGELLHHVIELVHKAGVSTQSCEVESRKGHKWRSSVGVVLSFHDSHIKEPAAEKMLPYR